MVCPNQRHCPWQCSRRHVRDDGVDDFVGATGIRKKLGEHRAQCDQDSHPGIISLDQKGMATYAFHLSETANFGGQLEDLPSPQRDDWLHIASLVTVMRPGSLALPDWANQLSCGLSYDINVRPTVISDARRVLGTCQPLAAHRGDTRRDPQGQRRRRQVPGPSRPRRSRRGDRPTRGGRSLGRDLPRSTWPSSRLGPGGAVALRQGGAEVRVPGFSTDVVDTIGAGDTFMAGLLDGYIHRRQNLSDALHRGAAAASIVLLSAGRATVDGRRSGSDAKCHHHGCTNVLIRNEVPSREAPPQRGGNTPISAISSRWRRSAVHTPQRLPRPCPSEYVTKSFRSPSVLRSGLITSLGTHVSLAEALLVEPAPPVPTSNR